MAHAYKLYQGDLPDGLTLGKTLAIDTEFMGLTVSRDRLCLLQIFDGVDGMTHMVQFARGQYDAPNAKKILSDASYEKIFYYARADMRWIGKWLGVIMENVVCLKIASRIARTYTQAHNLEDVLKQVMHIRLSKEQQCTDWGRAELQPEQLEYACNDVVYLHELKNRLHAMMAAEGREEIAKGLYKCLPHIVRCDLAGWDDEDLFAYHPGKVAR